MLTNKMWMTDPCSIETDIKEMLQCNKPKGNPP